MIFSQYTKHFPQILSLGLPLIGGHLAGVAIGVSDTMMMGWYGVPELAAVVLGGGFHLTIFLFGTGFGFAIMPLIATAIAKGHEAQIRRVTRMAMWLSIAFSIVIYPAYWFSDSIFLAVGQEASLAADAGLYLKIVGLGLLPMLIVMTLRTYLAALEQVQIAFFIVLLSLGLNILGNYILIFGNLGAPELGLMGAALASVTTQILALFAIVAVALWRNPEHQLLNRFWRPDWRNLGLVFRLGLPIGLTTLAEVTLFTMTSILMGWMGPIALAAHGIALQVSSLTFMVHVGLSNVATIRVGTAFGMGDYGALRKGAVSLSIISLAFVVITITAFYIFPAELSALFLDPNDQEFAAIIEIAVALLAVAAFFQLADAAQVIGVGLLRGLQDTTVPFGFAFVGYWLLGAPAAYVLTFPMGMGPVGLWYGLLIGLSVAAFLVWGRFVLLSRNAALALRNQQMQTP